MRSHPGTCADAIAGTGSSDDLNPVGNECDRQRIGTGLSFVIFPIVFVFAFSVHPDLLHPHLLGPSELIQRARGESVLQFAHALVTLNAALLVVVAMHFMKLLDRSAGAWAGFLGGAAAVVAGHFRPAASLKCQVYGAQRPLTGTNPCVWWGPIEVCKSHSLKSEPVFVVPGA